jgi:hypothetical protein
VAALQVLGAVQAHRASRRAVVAMEQHCRRRPGLREVLQPFTLTSQKRFLYGVHLEADFDVNECLFGDMRS